MYELFIFKKKDNKAILVKIVYDLQGNGFFYKVKSP